MLVNLSLIFLCMWVIFQHGGQADVHILDVKMKITDEFHLQAACNPSLDNTITTLHTTATFTPTFLDKFLYRMT